MITPLKAWDSIKRGYLHGDSTWYGAKHRGTDYFVSSGTPIYAPCDCEIVLSKRFLQGGNTIWIKFNDEKYGQLLMRCLHLRELPLVGKRYEGAILAFVGNTGIATTPHLHLDISKEELKLYTFSNFIDPEPFFATRANVEFAKKWEGKFILDVDVVGELYYVHDGKRYYIGQTTTLQSIAEKFATGFRHDDVMKIPVGD